MIESMNNTLVKNITVGSFPEHILFNPSNKKIYVANVISNTISVIDGDANAVTNEVEVGNDPGDFSNCISN